MKALIKKEIRLLMPAWIVAMLLAIVPGSIAVLWRITNEYGPPGGTPVILVLLAFAVGVLFLGITAFGQELNCNTFTALLSQPAKRRRLWLIKVTTLAAAFASVWFVAMLLVWWNLDISVTPPWSHMNLPMGRRILESLKSAEAGFLTLAALVAFSGGLWTTLLLRQTTTAFWISLLMPVAIICGIVVVLQDWIVLGRSVSPPIIVALVLYSGAGFFAAWRLFMRAQDIQWTSGEVSLPRRKKVFKTGAVALPVRPAHWFSALAWKEMQLHGGTILIAVILFVLHMTAVLVRKFHPHLNNPDWEFTLNAIWTLWLLMPLLIGAAAIAEERRMGTIEPQLCLPISRRAQLFIKLFAGLVLSLLFGALAPVLIEGNQVRDHWHWIFVAVAAMFFVSFYASSLGRTTLQAISYAILTVLLVLYYVTTPLFEYPGLEAHFGPVERYLDISIFLIVLVWLTFSNFKHVHQNRRFWVRNIAAILAVFIFIRILLLAIYICSWETLRR